MSNRPYQKEQGGYLLTTEKNLMQAERIQQWFSREYTWSRDIPLSVIQTSIENSLCFGVFDHSNPDRPQVAYVRVVSDYATFGWICDLYVEPAHRGWLTIWLVQSLFAHPDLKDLRRMLCVTVNPRAQEIWESFGFSKTNPKEAWLEKKDHEIFTKMKLRRVA